MRKLFLFLVFLISLVGEYNKSFAIEATGEAISIKAHLEEGLAKRYRERIATRIPLELFNVSAQVDFVINRPAEKAEKPQTEKVERSELTPDLSLGIINSVESVAVVPQETKNNIELKRIDISVGMSGKLDKVYQDKFKTWLIKTVSSEFGKIGRASVNELVPVPKEEIKPEPPPQARPLNPEEKFGNYQNAIGFGVLSFVLLGAVLLFKLLPSKDNKEQQKIDIKMAEMKREQQLAESFDQNKLIESNLSVESDVDANLKFESLKQHQKKVAMLAFSHPDILDKTIERWLEEGESGGNNIACLIDATLCFINEPNSTEANLETARWTIPERLKHDKDLATIFSNYPKKSLAERLVLIETVYWDLLSYITMGENISRSPFSSLANLPSGKIHKLLSQQDKKVQSLAIAHLPPEKMSAVLSNMTFEEKKDVVLNVYDTPKIRIQEIEMADQALKFIAKKEETEEDGYIAIQSLVPQLIGQLQPLEEVKLIKQIQTQLSDQGSYLKSSYPCLAFINEWPSTYLKMLLSGLPNQTIRALVASMPEDSEQILNALPPRTQVIIRDMIKNEIPSEELNTQLGNIKIKMFRLINNKQLDLAQIFRSSEDDQTDRIRAA